MDSPLTHNKGEITLFAVGRFSTKFVYTYHYRNISKSNINNAGGQVNLVKLLHRWLKRSTASI